MQNDSMTRPAVEWLEGAAAFIADLILQTKAASVVPPVTITVGFPSVSALAKKRRVGECWRPEASEDKRSQIFITPLITEAAVVLEILAHELGHACYPEAKHGKVFKQYCKALGLEGKATSTFAGVELAGRLAEYTKRAGAYPYPKLVPVMKDKKQTTRQKKVYCLPCEEHEDEIIFRVTRKVLAKVEEAGKKPVCWICGKELLQEEGEGE